MNRPGLLRTVSIVAGLVLAIPMAVIGFEFLAQDRLVLGVGFLALAVLFVYLPEYILQQLPRPRTILLGRFDRFRRGD